MNSRDKGARGEREFSNLIEDYLGMQVKRRLSAARDGGDDIRLAPYSIEVKRSEKPRMKQWWAQTRANAGESKPLLAFRWNGGEWLVAMPVQDWIELSREEIVEAAGD